MLALAQQPLGNLETFVVRIGSIINTSLPIVVALALLFFFYGLARFVLAAGDEEAKKKGKDTMIWGIVALFVMVSVWGLVAFLGNALGIRQGEGLPNVPRVNQVN